MDTTTATTLLTNAIADNESLLKVSRAQIAEHQEHVARFEARLVELREALARLEGVEGRP